MKKLIMCLGFSIFLISCGEQADGGGDTDGIPQGNHRIFISSTTLTGNFADGSDAFTVADARCAELAQNAGLGSTYKAIISTDTTDANTVITLTGSVYVVDNTGTAQLVAGSTDFWDTTNQNLLFQTGYDENGNAVTGSPWTGTDETGGGTGSTCNSWTSTSGSGTVGDSSRFGTEWIDSDFESCANSYRIYCISQ